MAVWETDRGLAATSPAMADFSAAWKRPVTIVYSTTLATPSTDNTRIERALDTELIHTLKQLTTGDLMIGGPDLAAIAAGCREMSPNEETRTVTWEEITTALG